MLWHRYCQAFEIDPAWAPEQSDRENVSIGAAETTLVRKLNRRLKRAGLPSEEYRRAGPRARRPPDPRTPLTPPYEQAVRSWTEHLRGGGTTPWSTWVRLAHGAPQVDVPRGWSAPGAAQLELVRRLAMVSRLDGATFARLADVVLHRSAPGRGLAQQPLSWPHLDGAPRRFGAPPTDPSDVPVDELVRVAVGTLTELPLVAPVPAGPRELTRGRFSRGPAFALAGAPVTTSVVRRERPRPVTPRVATRRGWSSSPSRSTWRSRRCGPPASSGSPRSGRPGSSSAGPTAAAPAVGRLPPVGPSVGRRGRPGSVHVLVAPHAAQVAGAVLGLHGRTRHPEQQPRWRDLSTAGVDVVRRVNAVLNVRAAGPTGPTPSAAAGRSWRPSLPARRRWPSPSRSGTGSRPGPARSPTTCARVDIVCSATCAQLVPPADGRSGNLPTGPRRDDVLRVAVEACLHQASAPRKVEQR